MAPTDAEDPGQLYSLPSVLNCPSTHTVRVQAAPEGLLSIFLLRIVPLECREREPTTVAERKDDDGVVHIAINANIDCEANVKRALAVLFKGAPSELAAPRSLPNGDVEGTFELNVEQMVPAAWRVKPTPDTYFVLLATQRGSPPAYLRDRIRQFACEAPACTYDAAWRELCALSGLAAGDCGCVRAQYDEASRLETCADVGKATLAAVVQTAQAQQCAVQTCASGRGVCVPPSQCTAAGFRDADVPEALAEMVCRGHPADTVCCIAPADFDFETSTMSQALGLQDNGYTHFGANGEKVTTRFRDGDGDNQLQSSAALASLSACLSMIVSIFFYLY